MTWRRATIVLSVFALVTIGCGGSTGGADTATTTAPAETPWATLPVPVRPPVLLTLEESEPVEIDALCLDIFERRAAEVDIEVIEGWLALLGVDVVTSGCDAVVAMEMTVTREDAGYLDGRRCWTGWTLSSEARIESGDAEAVWTHDDVVEPVAQSIGDECPQFRDPIDHRWDEVPYDDALADALGIPARLAMEPERSGWTEATGLFPPGDSQTLAWLEWWLVDSVRNGLETVDGLLESGRATPADLEPLVPRLITLLRDPTSQDEAHDILSRITGTLDVPGQRYEDDWRTMQKAYWEWWSRRSEP